ncbi:MAG: lipopolysaccharide biosynthesis protein [Microthrixaceae bacterium]
MQDAEGTAAGGATAMERVLDVARNGRSALTVGLLVDGVASYLFLTAAGRALGPDRFATVSVLWAVLFLVGNGLFIPVEQELSRSIAARAARGVGHRNLVQRVATLTLGLFVVTALVAFIFKARIADSLFRDQLGYVTVLVIGIGGVALAFVVRGILAGTNRYHGFAVLFLSDAAAKALPAVALALAGVTQAMAYAVVMAGSAFVGALVPMSARDPRPRLPEEAPPAWSPLASSMGFLLLTSFLTALTVNVGTLSVEVLGERAEADAAGIFLSGLVIARVPLFLFQAVQAIVLPRLSELAATGDVAGFRRYLRVLAGGMAGCTVAGVLGSALLGPLLVRVLFGEDFALLGARDMALLTLASMLMTCAMTVNQAQIALHHQRQTGWPWGVATLAFLVVTGTAANDLFLRVELGMVAAGAVALLLAAVLLARELRTERAIIELRQH